MSSPTWPSTNVTSITGTGAWATYGSWNIVASKSTSTSVFFDQFPAKGFEFRAVNGNTEIWLNTDDNTDDPGFVRVNGATAVQNAVISVNDSVELLRYETHPWTNPANSPSTPTTSVFTFTVTLGMLYTWSGPSTLGNTPTYQWSGAFVYDTVNATWNCAVTGYNETVGEHIYLYDNSDATGTPLLTFSFALSSTSSTLTLSFTPEMGKTYYIMKANQAGTANITLASKRFSDNKVYCNFW